MNIIKVFMMIYAQCAGIAILIGGVCATIAMALDSVQELLPLG